MLLLADENVKGRLVRWLRAHGHAVVVAPKGTKNSALVALAASEQKVLLTNNTDFLNIGLYPVKTSPPAGRIVLRVFPSTFENQRDRLAALLAAVSPDQLAGKLAELRTDAWELHTK